MKSSINYSEQVKEKMKNKMETNLKAVLIPTEKAKELYDYFYAELYSLHSTRPKIAAQCALIAVNEIIDAIKVFYNGSDWQLVETMGWKYWQQVKEEIINHNHEK